MIEKIEEFNWHIVSEDSKKHIVGTFNIDKKYDSLTFICSYNPKHLFDEQKCLELMKATIKRDGFSLEEFNDNELKKQIPLANHISWSIDSPKEWLGTKHKHNPKQILRIDNEKSTFGFKNSPIYEGHWRVTASLTAVVTDDVDISVYIEGEIKDEMD